MFISNIGYLGRKNIFLSADVWNTIAKSGNERNFSSVVLKGEDLKEFKKTLTDLHGEGQLFVGKRTKSLTILTKRAMLRIGMLLTTNIKNKG